MLERLGRYELQDILGQGGMATVYRGYDPLMGREVAVKVLIPILARDPVFRTRFESEIRAVSKLEHPAIVPVYDAGEEEGYLYLVMRLMEDNLRNRLQSGPLPFPEALAILQRIGSALEAAHRAGIIHRDVKPSNVLFDRYGAAYLSDFGIARLASLSETLTGSQLMGTPTYMSPEQIEGRKDIDHRADVYALGILFFHMLAGQPPFQGETPSRVMFLHLTEPPPSILHYRPDAPPELQRVLEKALAKRPEDRFGSAMELVRAAEAALAPVLASSEGMPATPRYPAGPRAPVGPTPAPVTPSLPAGATPPPLEPTPTATGAGATPAPQAAGVPPRRGRRHTPSTLLTLASIPPRLRSTRALSCPPPRAFARPIERANGRANKYASRAIRGAVAQLGDRAPISHSWAFSLTILSIFC